MNKEGETVLKQIICFASCLVETKRKCDSPSPHSSCSSSFSVSSSSSSPPVATATSSSGSLAASLPSEDISASSIERKCSPANREKPESKDPFRNHLTCPIPGCAKQRATITTMRSHLSKEHQKGKGPPKEWLVSTDSKLCPKCQGCHRYANRYLQHL